MMVCAQEVEKDVSLSALESVRQNHAHCLEGGLLGTPPLAEGFRVQGSGFGVQV